jgi:hypothetical protein
MHRTSSRALVMAGGLVITAAYAAAAAPSARAAVRSMGPEVQADSVTGCLQKGAKDTYTITGQDGKKYDVTSKTVPLKNHVGHTVTVTGAPGKTPTELDVSKLDMVSPSCKS